MNGFYDSVLPRTGSARRLAWPGAAVVCAALVLICLRTLFQGGYLIEVDYVSGPQALPLTWSFTTPVALLVRISSAVVGTAVTGRLYVAGALFVCAFAPTVLFRRHAWYVQCAAGLLGALNPWVYDRLVEGQWGPVVAAGGLFLWLAAWEALQAREGVWPALRLAMVSLAIVAFDPHFVGMILVLAVAAAVWQRIWRDGVRLRWASLAMGLFCVGLLYGAIPFFIDNGPGSYAAVRTFTRADFATFASTPSPRFGLFGLVGLFGYWGEATGRFPLGDGGVDWWLGSALVLVTFAVAGALRHRDRAWLLIVGLFGLAISASTATGAGLDAAVAFAQRFPLAAAYREPGKWGALWLLALVVLAGTFVSSLEGRSGLGRRGFPAQVAAFAAILAALLPVGITAVREIPAAVTPVEYPQDWYLAADYLRDHVPGASSVVVLPWYQYVNLPFNGNRIAANPAPVVFPGRLLTSDDPNIPGAVVPSPHNIGRLSQTTDGTGCRLAEAVRALGVRWVVVEPVPGGPANVAALKSCGFRPVLGGPGRVEVLNG